MAFILALTVRCFVVEAYQIPTGSMAPTLYGSHLNVTCPSCNATFVVGQRDNENYGGDFVCPACGRTGAMSASKVSERRGDRILVAKDLYLFSKPRRWDVFVFKSPQTGKQEQNFVKRIVGLPGEHVELRNGQVFVNGSSCPSPSACRRSSGSLSTATLPTRSSASPTGLRSDGRPGRQKGLLLKESPTSWQTVEYARRIYDFYRTTPARAATW